MPSIYTGVHQMIVDRYLLRQTMPSLLAVILTLSFLFITFTLARLLTDAGAGLLQLSEVLRVTWLRWLIAQDVLVPISLYVSVILVWGRLYQEQEMGAMIAGGMSPVRLMRPLAGLAVLLALMVAIFSLEIRPWAWREIYEIKAAAQASAEIERIRSDRFNRYGEDHTVFIDRIYPDGSIEGVFVRKRKAADFELLSAPKGLFTPYAGKDFHKLTLFDAMSFQQFDHGADRFGHFDTMTLNLDAGIPAAVSDRAKVKPSIQLLSSEDAYDYAELQWRVSTPVITLLLLLTAIPLSRTGPRQSRYARLILALAIYAVYFNLLGVARTWVEQDKLPTIGWVHGLLILFIATIWWREILSR